MAVTAPIPDRGPAPVAIKPRSGWRIVAPPADREKVLTGRDGWLFLQRDTNRVLDQHQGLIVLSRGELRAWRRTLRRRLDLVGASGATWLTHVVPDKEAVYADMLPEAIRPVARRPVHQVLELAHSLGLPIVYGLSAQLGARGREDVYSRTDSHWNQFGAYVGYRLICRELRARGIAIRTVGEDEIRWVDAMSPGGLGARCHPPRESRVIRAELAGHRSRLTFDNRVRVSGRVMIFEQNDRLAPAAVIFGESFANNMLVFLKESFRRLVFVHTNAMVEEVVKAERPEVVISLPAERFLIRPPNDRGALAALTRKAEDKVRRERIRPGTDLFLQGITGVGGPASADHIGEVPWRPARGAPANGRGRAIGRGLVAGTAQSGWQIEVREVAALSGPRSEGASLATRRTFDGRLIVSGALKHHSAAAELEVWDGGELIGAAPIDPVDRGEQGPIGGAATGPTRPFEVELRPQRPGQFELAFNARHDNGSFDPIGIVTVRSRHPGGMTRLVRRFGRPG